MSQDLSAYGLASRIGGRQLMGFFEDFGRADSSVTNGTGRFLTSQSGTWALYTQPLASGGVLRINCDTTAVYSGCISQVPAFPVSNEAKGAFRVKAFTNTDAAGIKPTVAAIGYRSTDAALEDLSTVGTQSYAILTMVESTGVQTFKACKAANTSQSVTLSATMDTTSFVTWDFNFKTEIDGTVTAKLAKDGTVVATITDAIESTCVLAPYVFVKNGASSTKGDATIDIDFIEMSAKISR